MIESLGMRAKDFTVPNTHKYLILINSPLSSRKLAWISRTFLKNDWALQFWWMGILYTWNLESCNSQIVSHMALRPTPIVVKSDRDLE